MNDFILNIDKSQIEMYNKVKKAFVSSGKPLEELLYSLRKWNERKRRTPDKTSEKRPERLEVLLARRFWYRLLYQGSNSFFLTHAL